MALAQDLMVHAAHVNQKPTELPVTKVVQTALATSVIKQMVTVLMEIVIMAGTHSLV